MRFDNKGWLGRFGRRGLAAPLVLLAVAVGAYWTPASAQRLTSQEKRDRMRAESPFDLNAGPNLVLESNSVQCGLNNTGEVCVDIFDSPTGGGGFWPSGTTNQYIFNSGLQIAGINSAEAGPWAADTVGAYFFDASGGQKHGAALTNIFSSLNPEDVAVWPADAFISDTTIFNEALVGALSISDEDTWVRYWDGDPNRLAGRAHPMGIEVTQRSLSFNSPAGAENTLFFIYDFKNVTNEAAFQQPNEARFNVSLPDGGWTIDNVHAAFAMDPDVTTDAGSNFSTGILPFNMGVAYKSDFVADDFNFDARASLYAPPFFAGPGFVGVKYLRSPVDPETGEEIGLTMFSNTLNRDDGFPDPDGVEQLFRYLSGTVSAALGDNECNTVPAAGQPRRLCFLFQEAEDTRFYQASGPFSLGPGESATIVVGYTHAAPVEVAQYEQGNTLAPGFPTRTPGANGQPIRILERIAGWISTPPEAIDGNGEIIEENVNFVPGSLLDNAIVAQSIFNNKFLLPRPPEPPPFQLVPGDNQVTVVWQPSATEDLGDPFFTVASDPTSSLFDANFRQFDVEGYRIYRSLGISGDFELIAEFDFANTTFPDVTCQFQQTFVPEEGISCEDFLDGLDEDFPNPVSLNGAIVQYPAGARVRDAVTGATVVTDADTVMLTNNGVPFAFVDNGVRNGLIYRYFVAAFDVNSLASGPSLLESPRQPQNVIPRDNAPNLELAELVATVTGDDGEPLNLNADVPAIDEETGIFAGPFPPTDGLETGFAPNLPRLLPQFTRAATIDSIILKASSNPSGEQHLPSPECPEVPGAGGLAASPFGLCWTVYLSVDVDGTITPQTVDGFSPWWGAFDAPPGVLVRDLPLVQAEVEFDATALQQFGVAGGSGNATALATFGEGINVSTAAGPQARRFGTFVGGSRWFDGENETVADPAALIRVGHVEAADTIWAPISHTPVVSGGAAPSNDISFEKQCFNRALGPLARAADIQVTWNGGTISEVRDVTHHVAVPFRSDAQISWGFLNTDANGNGFLDWQDFNYVDFALQMVRNVDGGDCDAVAESAWDPDGLLSPVDLSASPTLMPTSTQGLTQAGVAGLAATGMGFGLYILGERFLFELSELPADGTVWTLRTYSGEVTADVGNNTSDPSGYSWSASCSDDCGEGVRSPLIPGLTISFQVDQATQLVGTPDLDLIHTIPDPFYVRSGFDIGPNNKQLQFVNLPARALIRIYSVNGTLVRAIEHEDITGGGRAVWDLRNRNNQFVASGVYFYHVQTPEGQEHIGRFTVVQFAQ